MAKPTLRRGSKHSDVKIVQRELGLTVDGIFGQKTEEAVKQFQRKKGIVVDGVVGPSTWKALGYDGGGSSGGGSTGAGNNSAPIPGGSLIDKLLSVVILYGIFKVLQKAL